MTAGLTFSKVEGTQAQFSVWSPKNCQRL